MIKKYIRCCPLRLWCIKNQFIKLVPNFKLNYWAIVTILYLTLINFALGQVRDTRFYSREGIQDTYWPNPGDLRVEEINPEYMLERSFFQFQNQSTIPDLYKQVEEKQNELERIKILDEHAIASYHHIREQLDILGKQFKHYITMPNYLIPFLQPGRMVKVENEVEEFEWGIIINFKKREDDKKNPLKSETVVILDVLLHVNDDFEKDSTPHPCQAGRKGSMEVVPVLHKLISKISSIRINLPNDRS